MKLRYLTNTQSQAQTQTKQSIYINIIIISIMACLYVCRFFYFFYFYEVYYCLKLIKYLMGVYMKNRKSLLSLYSAKNYYIWKLFHIYVFSRCFYSKRLTVHSGYTCIFCQHVCSLGIEPSTFCAANAMLYH